MKRFKRIYVEITNICNLKCSFCPPSGREPEYMNENLFNSILEQIDGLSEYIYFHVKGEPLLHPGLQRFLELCSLKNFKVNIATNGTFIGKASETLLESPAVRQVSFSLHSLEEADNISSAGKYLDDIIAFALEAERRTGIYVELKLWNLNRGDPELNRFILEKIRGGLNIHVELPEEETNGKGCRIRERIFISRAKQFMWPDINLADSSPRGFCYGLKTQAAILVDGTVVPCCLDGCGIIKLGNVTETQFPEIISSRRAMEIIKGFSERRAVEELCRKCSYRNRFDL